MKHSIGCVCVFMSASLDTVVFICYIIYIYIFFFLQSAQLLTYKFKLQFIIGEVIHFYHFVKDV